MKISLDKIDLPERDLRASIDEEALDELAATMRDHGQLQAIGVKFKPDDRYEVVYGSRRTRAARLLKWSEINAELVEDNANTTSHAKKLIENVQRLDMTPMEEAYGLLDLIGDGEADIRELQRQTGKSRAWVQTRLELAALPEDLQGAVQAGVINIGVARAFGTIEDAEIREHYLKAAVENGCTTEQAHIWANQAQFAKSGIVAMDNFTAETVRNLQQPQVVDQKYNCFVDGEAYSWRKVNFVAICGDCQEIITANRNSPLSAHTHTPVDTPETRA